MNSLWVLASIRATGGKRPAGLISTIQPAPKGPSVRVSFDTIEWDCGVDLDPEFIYAKCQAASET